MKKLLFLLLVVGTVPAIAQTQDDGEQEEIVYPYLLFTMNDGSVKTFASDNLSMTINEGVLLVASGEETEELSLQELTKMCFSETEGTPTTISTLPTTEKNEPKGEVYDLMGRRVQHPAKGMYIQNGKKVWVR